MTLTPHASAPLDELLEQALGPALGPVVQALGDYICRRMQGKEEGSEWVSQHGSLLGNRRHCSIVRRLVSEGDPRAVHDASRKRFLLRRDALTEQLHRLGVKPDLVKAPPSELEFDEEEDAYTQVMAKVKAVRR